MKNFLLNYFEKKGIKVKEDEDLFEKGYIDSIGLFRLLLEIEVNFGKELTIEDLVSLKVFSINEIVKLAERK